MVNYQSNYHPQCFMLPQAILRYNAQVKVLVPIVHPKIALIHLVNTTLHS